MDNFEKFVLDRIKEEMGKKNINNRGLAKLLKGENYKEKKDDVWISQKLSGKRELKITEFGNICEKLEVDPSLIFLQDLNPFFMNMSIGEFSKFIAKTIAKELK